MQPITTNMITCEHCGKLHPAGTAVCDVCGQGLAAWPYLAGAVLVEELGLDRLPPALDLSAELKALSGSLCPWCGGANRAGASFCVHCGRALADQPPGEMARAPGPGQLVAGGVLHGRYQVLRKIAQGGIGAVYEVSDRAGPAT